MKFNSVKRGNFSGLARGVSQNADAIFRAARDTSVNHTAIAKASIEGRSTERRAAMKAEGKVAQAGLKAFANVKDTKNKIESAEKIADIKRPAKRMAGIVGGLGAIATGYVSLENSKKDKADREELRGLRDSMNSQREADYQKSKQENEELMNWIRSGREGSPPGIESIEGAGSLLESSDPKPSAPVSQQSGATTNPATVTPKPSTTGPQAKATISRSPGFKGFVDMAAQAGAKYPQLVAAQWALESGWGKTPSGKNNYFGIKATAGESSTSKQTWEVYDGKEVTTSANFKNYETPQGSVNDLVNKWHKDYKSYSGVNNAPDAFSAADMLRQQGYATDPAYSEKLKKIMRDQGY